VAPFDAELYLRLLGERGLMGASVQQRIHDPELFEVARALVAVGAIDPADATEIAEAYDRAAGLRNGRGIRSWHQRQTTSTPTTSEPRRTVLCNVTVERPTEEIRIRSVTLSPSETRLSVLIRASGGARLRSRRNIPMKAMYSYQITDDRGGKGTTDFTGGGNDRERQGRLTVNPPLAVDTTWIELDGTRIELVDESSLCTVTVEPLADGDPAQRHIGHWLAAGERHGRPQLALAAVLDALIAAGYLGAGEPQLAAIRHASEHQHPQMAQRLSGSTSAPMDGAPPEWRSLLNPRPGRRTARGTVALTADTLPFDGVTVTANELTADEHGWQVEVDVTGASVQGPFGGSLDDPRIAWWAVDDHGQYYLGHLGSFSGSSNGLSGTVEFSPGLDRAATTLSLLPTGPTERARIEFPLNWSEQ
jgi:hypothetical protein